MKHIWLLYSKIILMLLFLIGCETGPQPIQFGNDSCAFCKMTIMDPKFGAEMITAKGKIYKYDDINCLIHHLKEIKTNPSDIKAYYVLDWTKPGTLTDAVSANYIFSEQLKTPMASNIAATASDNAVDSMLSQWKGKRMEWNDVMHYFIKN